jgi:hypothetical protein
MTLRLEVRRSYIGNLKITTYSIGKSFIWIAIVLLATYQGEVGADQLTGKMVKLSYLLGKWTCENYLRDTNALRGVTTFKVSAPNTIHEHAETQHVESDSYFGYNPTAGVYYVTGSDSEGTTFGSSEDGTTYSETMQGVGVPPYMTTVTLQSVSSDTLRIHGQTIINGMTTDGFTDCHR